MMSSAFDIWDNPASLMSNPRRRHHRRSCTLNTPQSFRLPPKNGIRNPPALDVDAVPATPLVDAMLSTPRTTQQETTQLASHYR